MPGYKAVITGENFEFIIDEVPQNLDFIRTVYVDANDENTAKESALKIVRADLLAQSLLDEESEQVISLELLQPIDSTQQAQGVNDFIWSFPEFD